MTTDDIKFYYTHGVFPDNLSKNIIEINISHDILYFWSPSSNVTPLRTAYMDMLSCLDYETKSFMNQIIRNIMYMYSDFISDLILLTHFIDDDALYNNIWNDNRATCEYYTYDISKLKSLMLAYLSMLAILKSLYLSNTRLNMDVHYHNFSNNIQNKLYFHIANRNTITPNTQVNYLESEILKVANGIRGIPDNAIYKYNLIYNEVSIDNHKTILESRFYESFSDLVPFMEDYKESRYKLFKSRFNI